jgi:mannose-6-phosphate isomerase-like protein (cupin superfamily)
MSDDSKRYLLADMNQIDGVPCPCGTSRRAFGNDRQKTASFHIVDIKQDSHLHYHKRTTEIYHVLEGSGVVELDGESVPVKPGSSILIKPGCRHRAVGKLRIINVVIPAFDPADEFVVD